MGTRYLRLDVAQVLQAEALDINAGLVGTIGYRVLNSDGTQKEALVTAGVTELSAGGYISTKTFSSASYSIDTDYIVEWTTQGLTPIYYREVISFRRAVVYADIEMLLMTEATDLNTGLVGTIGYRILNSDGTQKEARTTTGIFELTAGGYAVRKRFSASSYPLTFQGFVEWDTGGGTPVYYREVISFSFIEVVQRGTAPVTIKVTEQNGTTLISDVNITIKNEAGTTLIATGKTNTQGVDNSFALDPAIYQVTLGKVGVNFSNPFSITVTASGGTFLLKGDTITINPPADASLCNVYGYVKDSSGVALAHIEVKATIASSGAVSSGSGVTNLYSKAKTNSTGKFSLNLIRSNSYKVRIQPMRYEKTVSIPNQATVDLFTL